jgi:putative endonuclease
VLLRLPFVFSFARLSTKLARMEKGGYVYILSSKGRRLYTGVTSQLQIRVGEHKAKKHPNSFTARYNVDRLVYYECFATIGEAIARESMIKNMHRSRKIEMILAMNRTWRDLSEPWGKPIPPFDESKLRAPETFGADRPQLND